MPGDGVSVAHVNTSPGSARHYTSGVTVRRLAEQGAVVTRVVGAMARHRPNVFHLTSSYDRAWTRDALFLDWARRLGASSIVNLRGGDFERFYASKDAAGQRSIRAGLERCGAVVPITLETATFLRSLGLTNVQIVPNCVAVRSALPPRQAASISRWLFVGWVMPAKGVLEILEVLRRHPNATLTLVGPLVQESGAETTDALAAMLREPAIAERVRHIPSADAEQIRALYAEHDLFVFPSRREGFPNVVLEAMEAGIPIVASRVGAMPEMLNDGTEGFLVPARDADALDQAVTTMITDPARGMSMAAAARERVERLYSVEAVVAQWRELYRALAAT
jgi:glycosyltransferase involved in cell wall biosynthesis